MHAGVITPTLPLHLALSHVFAPTSPLPRTRASSRSTVLTYARHLVLASPLTSLRRPIRTTGSTFSRASLPSTTLANARSSIRPVVSSDALPLPLSSILLYAHSDTLSVGITTALRLIHPFGRTYFAARLLPILRTSLAAYAFAFSPHRILQSTPPFQPPAVRVYVGSRALAAVLRQSAPHSQKCWRTLAAAFSPAGSRQLLIPLWRTSRRAPDLRLPRAFTAMCKRTHP